MFKKFFSFFRFTFLITAFLFLLLPFMFFSVLNKSFKKAKNILGFQSKDSSDDQIFTDNQAWADVPGGGGSTPFLSVWNGNEYIFENDVLMSADNNYNPSFSVAKRYYENNNCGADLYKINNKSDLNNNGELKLQIKEMDPEESFIDQIKVFKVEHGEDEEILVDNKYQNFYVLARKIIEKAVMPEQISIDGEKSDLGEIFGSSFLSKQKGVRLHYGHRASLNFPDLKMSDDLFLIMRVKERGWSPIAKTIFTTFPAAYYLTIATLGLASRFFLKDFASFLPIFALIGGGNRSIKFSYDNNGKTGILGEIHPRMAETIELVPVSKEAISAGGKLNLNLEWTRTHHLISIGVVNFDKSRAKNCKLKELELIQTRHSRVGQDFSPTLKNRDKNYMHTVQGDTIDLIFKDKFSSSGTYLVSASGFYTDLRVQHQKVFRNLAWLIKETA